MKPAAQRRKKLRAQIIGLFKTSKTPLYFSTLADKTGADLEDAVATCRALMKEGRITVAHPSRQSRRLRRRA